MSLGSRAGGLDAVQAARRLEEHGPNQLPAPPSRR
ncbi:cation-transporting P-type ATPase [Hyphomonas sp.]